LHEVAGTDLEHPVVFALGTGLRLGEVMGLRWQDIDVEGRSTKVNQVLQITMEFDVPMTHRSSRTVSLPAFVVEALKRQRKRQNERRLIIGHSWQDLGS